LKLTSWRILKTKLAANAFDGEGARIYGGRWNSVGIPLIYTSANVSLAILEVLVHLGEESLLHSYSLARLEFDSSLIDKIDTAKLPPGWKESPVLPALQAFGDAWVASKTSAILEVPSAIVEYESNFLINPHHKDFSKIKISTPKPFPLDERLFKK
jgi:RES domain-containing protein